MILNVKKWILARLIASEKNPVHIIFMKIVFAVFEIQIKGIR